jgi:hypothetical protein
MPTFDDRTWMPMKEQSMRPVASQPMSSAMSEPLTEPFARKFMAMMNAKEPMADYDTVSVSTHAPSTTQTFSGSGSAPSSYESTTDSAELKEALKPVKEKRTRRNENQSTKGMPFTQAMYKRRFCCHYPDIDQCKRGKKCAFAHSRAEFRGSLLPAEEEHEGEHSDEFYMYRYKTLWCPIGIPHHWKNCVYGHNHLDIRRSPDIGYGPRQCPHWYNCNDKTPYADRCPNGVRCPYTHGAKEQLYHPAYFKTAVCWDVMSEGGCPRSHFCAFHHTKEECRVEETKDMKYDYTRPLGEEEMALLQKDFNMPIPIAADVDAKPGKKDHMPPPPPAPKESPPAERPARRPDASAFSLAVSAESWTRSAKAEEMPAQPVAIAAGGSGARGGDGSVMFMPAMFPYPFVMHPQMVNGAGSQAPGGTKVMMMPVMMPGSSDAQSVPAMMRPGKVDELLAGMDIAPESVSRVLDALGGRSVGSLKGRNGRPDIMDLRN